MRTSTICLIVLSAAATLASARPSISYLAHNLRSASYKRQSSVPSQCASTCDPVNNEVNAGCSPTACCTQSFETAYYNCILCVGNADNVTDYSAAQVDLDNLYVSCYNLGYPLQELTLPGQNPSRSLSTSAPATATSPVATSFATATSSSGTVTSLSKTTITSLPKTTTISTINPSSTSPASSGVTTGSATATSSTSTSTGAALGVGSRKRGVWALAAAAVGLVII